MPSGPQGPFLLYELLAVENNRVVGVVLKVFCFEFIHPWMDEGLHIA